MDEKEDVKAVAKEQKPSITFEDVSVDYVSVFDSNLVTWTSDNTLELQSSQDQISFAYRTVDLMHPTAVQYRYQLNNAAWSPWSDTITKRA